MAAYRDATTGVALARARTSGVRLNLNPGNGGARVDMTLGQFPGEGMLVERCDAGQHRKIAERIIAGVNRYTQQSGTDGAGALNANAMR